MLSNAVTLVIALFVAGPAAGEYFAIAVVDDQTGRGVPLVELRTVDNVRYLTDSAGMVAFHEPALMGQKVYFHVRSHGYELAADGFGYRGKALDIVPGGTAELRVRRINVAERIYRVTGAGIYRDSVLLGRETPIRLPLLNAQVVGSDSVNTAVYRGKIHWFWGDTNRPSYPLGTFHTPGATSLLPGGGGLAPDRGVDLEYFQRDDGFVAGTAEMPGEGPTWIDGLCVIRDSARGERMFAKYVKIRKFLEAYERGLVEFNDDKKRFEHVATFDFEAPLYPLGHALSRTVAGTPYVYFGNPYPLVRVRADAAALADPKQYEAFTCLAAHSRANKPAIDRDSAGVVRYGWKRDTHAATPKDEAKWRSARLLNEGESLLALRDVETGIPVVAHAGSVAWSEFRKRFVMIAEQSGGSSNLGEIWYAEADTPVGPWVYARKIVTHDKYSYYNPKHHAMLDQDHGRTIYFEGTYSTFFAGAIEPTPRYDYNQIMYRLDLADARLAMPVAVYADIRDGRQILAVPAAPGEATDHAARKIAFMALDRPRNDAVPIMRSANDRGASTLVAGPTDGSKDEAAAPPDAVAFYALAAKVKPPPATTALLHEWRHPTTGLTWYAIEGDAAPPGYVRNEKPICRVWRLPIKANIDWR